jgi:hypothetical protein
MPAIFQDSREAYAQIDTSLRQWIESDDEVLRTLSKLSADDLAEVRQKWNEKQRGQMRIATGTRQVQTPVSPGAAFGAASRGGDKISEARTRPTTRPLYDEGTEGFLQEWAQTPDIFDWSSADQSEMEGVTSLLLSAYPARQEEILGPARTRARDLLYERGQLLEGEDENMGALITNELTRRTSAAGGAMGLSTVADIAQQLIRADPGAADPGGTIAAGSRLTREEATEAMNRATSLSAENRRLFRLAYDNDTALTEMLSTGAAWLGGANALFRRSIGALPKVQKMDPTGTYGQLTRSGAPRMVEAPFKVNPVSMRGLAEGAAYDVGVGFALGPEYAPSFIAQSLGMEPGRISSALESGAIGGIMGTAMRQLSNASVLRQARKMPQFADVADASASEFKRVFKERMPDVFEDMRREYARRAGGAEGRRAEAGGQRESTSMGGEFVDDMPATVARPPEALPPAPARTAAAVPETPTPVAPAPPVATTPPVAPPAAGVAIETDPVKIQEIRNSIAEGESILRTGEFHGRARTPEQLEAVRRAVNNSRAQLGLEPTKIEPAAPPAPSAKETKDLAKITRPTLKKAVANYRSRLGGSGKRLPQPILLGREGEFVALHPQSVMAANLRGQGWEDVALEGQPPRQQAAAPTTPARAGTGEPAGAAGNKQPAPTAGGVKKGRPGFGTLPDGSEDLLTTIEAMGGIRSPARSTGGEADGFAETFGRQPLRMLVHRDKGSTVDQLMGDLQDAGYHFASTDDFYAAAEQAVRTRKAMQQQVQAAEDRDLFYRTALDNKGGRRNDQKPSALEITQTNELNVGDEWKIKGERTVVSAIDPDGTVIVDDGPRFGTNIELPPDAVIFPDRGTLKRADVDTSFAPEGKAPFDLERATPEQLQAEAQRRADLATTRAQAEEMAQKGAAPLKGDSSDVGQGRLFEGDEDLFSGQSAEALENAARPTEYHAGGATPFTETMPPLRADTPDWVKSGGETRAGRRIIEGIERPGKKPEFGPRSIIDYVNDAVRVEMRKSRSQTSKRHPAHYRPTGHVVFTRDGNRGDYGFHEAGHGLKELIEARDPGFFERKPLADHLIAITKRPGSMASAKNTHEGVAEWLRLRVKNPAALEGSPVTPQIEAAMDTFLPGTAQAIRDAARAWERFQRMPAADRWRMLNRDMKEAGTFRLANVLDTLGLQSEKVMATLASGAPLSAIDRRIFRAIMRNRQEIDKTYKAALDVARQVRGKTARILHAHNNILNISSEVQNAMAGTSKMKGLRIIGPDGNFVMVSEQTWREVMALVPGKQWDQFQHAGWARESLNRFEKAGLEYPGMREGMGPKDLRAIVAAARKEIPKFDEAFAAVQRYFDALLDIKQAGGLKKLGEVEKMRQRGEYWPLPRVMWGNGAAPASRTRSAGHIHAGDHRARGSSEAIRDLTEVAEQRTREAFDGYYWNQLGLRMADNLGEIARNEKLPMAARAIAGRVLQPLKLERKVAATMTREEGQNLVYEALVKNVARDLGLDPAEIRQSLKPEDINLAWDFKDIWRTTAPSDYNVISLLRGGERTFYQVDDAQLFHYFANADQPHAVSKAMEWLLMPSVQNWKRNITQSIEFATFRNLMGDLINQVALNHGAISWIPGGATTLGIWNKFFKKYPQVFDKGLLLSRADPTSVEMVNQMRHSAPYRFITEGLYVSRHPNRLVRYVSTALQPANWLYPFHKTADLYNLATGGRFVAPFFEGATREGAAVAVKMGGGTDEAARDAYWRATGRFNEHPSQADVRTLSRTPGFYNPMVQAIRGIGQNLTDPDPVISGTTWFKLLAYVPAIFGAAAAVRYATMSEEEKERERERPIEQRTNYYDVHGYQLRFPLGIEGAMASLTYNAVMDDLLDRESLEGQRTAQLYTNRIVSWEGGFLRFLGPQVQAAQEAQSNWSSFFQRNIVSPWMMGLPASEQYRSETPEFYRQLGQWFNYSPDKLQHLMRSGIARQADDVIDLLGRIEGGRPIQEHADLPFVGRLFIREPLGFGSQSVQDLTTVEQRIHLIELRLQAKGWSNIETWPAAMLTPETQALQTQIAYLRAIRSGANQLQRFSEMAKTFGELGNHVEERNMRRAMVEYAQQVLLHNREQVNKIEEALNMVNDLPRAPEERMKTEAIQRRLGR